MKTTDSSNPSVALHVGHRMYLSARDSMATLKHDQAQHGHDAVAIAHDSA